MQLGCPITLSASPVEVERSPLLGEHTEEILDWLGRSPAQIAALKHGRRGLSRATSRMIVCNA